MIMKFMECWFMQGSVNCCNIQQLRTPAKLSLICLAADKGEVNDFSICKFVVDIRSGKSDEVGNGFAKGFEYHLSKQIFFMRPT